MKKLLLLLLFIFSINGKLTDLLEKVELKIETELDDLIKEINELRKDIPNRDEEKNNDDVDIITKIDSINEKEHAEVIDVDILPRPKEDKSSEKRNAVFNRDALWNTKDIAYTFSTSLSSKKKAVILGAFEVISNNSCITFHEKTDSDQYYLEYFSGSGCYSYVGRYKRSARNGQPVSIGNGCGYIGTAIHETLHALGFYHEQSRYDRDKFVEILWENISDGKEFNFKKLTRQGSDNLGTEYDYDGVMHYSKYAFSKNGKPTILSITNPSLELGQRNGLSQVDADQLYKLYDCTNTKHGWSEWSLWTTCSPDCVKERSRFCYSDNEDDDCRGRKYKTKKCRKAECKLDGHWGRWSSWSSCSNPRCGSSTETRTRQCNDPAPQKGGKSCVGLAVETNACTPGCPNNCTFDTGICEFTKTGTWKHKSGRTPSPGTGPSTDVSGSGKYIYMEATGLSEGDVSVLTSAPFPANSASCLTFEYHMYGVDMGSLNVSVSTATETTQLDFISGDHGNNWKLAKCDISMINGEFKIVFTATRGPGYRSDVALDNIVVGNVSCR